MVNLIRKILYPISLLYGLITFCRNKAFDIGWLSSKTFDIPIVAVGNLNVGGTGKSPMIEYLIRLFAESLETAVISRGYARQTKGFKLATTECSAKELGDEPFQFYRKFRDLVVAVDENRVRGVETLRRIKPDLDLILLDDAFQHRYVKASTYILLTAFERLYVDDYLLPTGFLRESKKGAARADIIIITKCPKDIDENKRIEIVNKISPNEHQNIFFSSIEYDDYVYAGQQKVAIDELKQWKVLLVTGIANPKPLIEFLKDHKVKIEHMKFADHEMIGTKHRGQIIKRFDALTDDKKMILTTEKDFVRNFIDFKLTVYHLPIKTSIIDEEEKFNELIESYVRKN